MATAAFDKSRNTGKPAYPLPTSLDIVVPTWNEADRIEQTLRSIHTAIGKVATGSDMACSFAIYVVDGGSEDATPQIARQCGVQVIECRQRGRGHQLAAGFKAGTGEWVVMIHADALVKPFAFVNLLKALNRRTRIVWGIMGHSYVPPSWKMMWVEWNNWFRFHFIGMAFGDQGIFVRREVMEKLGGIPQQRLMEDVEISLRLSPFPRYDLGRNLEVSTRRWEKKKALKYIWQVMKFVLIYLIARRLGKSTEQLSEKLYAEYYRK